MQTLIQEGSSAVAPELPPMNRIMRLAVFGTPAPQGSKTAMPIYTGSKAKGTRAFSGRVALRESSKKVKPWRDEVTYQVRGLLEAYEVANPAPWTPIQGAVFVRFIFTLDRPKGIPKRVLHHLKYPDLSKLVRSTEDAITQAGLWGDDARIIGAFCMKVYVGFPGALPEPGALIEVFAETDVPT